LWPQGGNFMAVNVILACSLSSRRYETAVGT